MTGVRIIVDHEELSAKLRIAQDAFSNPFEMYENIGEVLVQSTRERFENSVDPDGLPWSISQRAEKDGGKTLVDTAALKDSITFIADDTGVEVGTNLAYAATHQFGAEITMHSVRSIGQSALVSSWNVTIPARPFIGLSEEDEIEIETVANDFIAEAFQEMR